MGAYSGPKGQLQPQGSDHGTDIISDEDIVVPGYDADLQFPPGEAKAARLRVDIFILPFIVLCFCFL